MEPEPASPSDNAAGLSLSSLGQVLSLAAAIVAPFYVIGFSILSLQIWNTYDFSIRTSWFIASLVSNKVVAGNAVAFLYFQMLIAILLTAVNLYLVSSTFPNQAT